MKLILHRSLGIFSLMVCIAGIAYSQCNPGKYAQECAGQLLDDYKYLRSYTIDGEGGSVDKVEYSYVFTKGTQYLIKLCTPGESTDGIVITLFDSNRRQVSSSLVNGEYVSAIAYPCNATGIYYITFTFDGSTQYCGGSAIGFKR